MTGASKILTVSYGTFSCTLEGFDDPFGTMKAIAEYFRDLAAEDRYFGAEPPTPDAAMLHRIAEREIQRRVEAKIQENGVVLRAADQAEPAPAVPAPKPAVVPAVLDAPAPAAESVADRLSRLRSEVAQQAAATTPVVSFALPEEDEGYDLPPVVEMPQDVAEAMAAATLEEEAVVAAEALGDSLDAGQPADVPSLSDIDLPFPEDLAETEAEALPEDTGTWEAEPEDAPQAATPSDTDALLAGLMADLAAPVSVQAPSTPAPTSIELVEEAEFSELLADDAPQAEADLTADDGLDIGALMQADAAPVAVEAQAEPVLPEAEDDITLSELDEAPEAKADDAALEEDAPFADDLTELGFTADEAAEPVRDTADHAEAEPVPVAEETSVLATLAADTVVEPDSPAVSGDDAPAIRPDAAEKLQRARARVVRIRRTEATAAPTSAPHAAESAPEPEAAPLLTPEAEADLEAELAALRQDADPVDTLPATDTAEPAANTTEPRRIFEGEAADAALNRLMAQADEHLEGAESKRRLSAIAHLKAAVAATVADRKAAGGSDPKAEQPSRLARYRDDLAMVVRNKLGVPSPQEPQGDRPAPLVLVSEQRIDRPRPVAVPNPPTASTPSQIRPRRIAGATGLALAEDDLNDDEDFDDPAPAADTRGFAEFSERLGAKTLADQLEAAAAYFACVERREHFTRPQLMRLAQGAHPEVEIGREEGLRSFGTLLRTGRLQKVRRGQFALSEASAYLAEGRRIAG